MAAKQSNKTATQTKRLNDAISLFDEMDTYRNRHRSYPIILFLISCATGARSFFWIIDLMTWIGLEKLHVTAPASASFVLIFVVVIAVFVLSLSALDLLGFRDIATDTGRQLSKLGLSKPELRQLGEIVTSHNWKHQRIFEDAVAKLAVT